MFVVLKPLCAVTDLLHYREPILQRSSKDKTGCWLVSWGVCLGIWEGSQRRGPGEQHTFAVRLVASVYKTHTVLCKLLDRVHDWVNRLHGSSSSSSSSFFFGFLSTPQLTTHKTPSLSQHHRYTTKKNPPKQKQRMEEKHRNSRNTDTTQDDTSLQLQMRPTKLQI